MSELPKSWTTCELGDVVDYGKAAKVEPSQIKPDDWVLELEDIEKDTSKILRRMTFAERQSKSTKNQFQLGDVLYGKLRPYLNKVVRADGPGLCTTEILPLRPPHEVHAGYLFHWLKHPQFLAYVNAVSHGLNMPRLGTEAGRAAPFVVAPRAEQERIAERLDVLLGRVDACRVRLDGVPGILKRLRHSVLAAALDGGLSSDWRELAGVNLDEWTPKALEQIAEIGTGTTPLRSNSSFYSETGTPWVTSSATGSEFVDSAAEYVTPAAIAAHRLKVYPPGTLLVAMYGEGKTRGQVTELRIHATINQACAAVTVDPSRALTSFVKLALRAQYEAMRAMAEGGNQPNLNLSKIKSISTRLPSKEEQAEIVRRVESLFALADAIEAKWQAARNQVERLTPALLFKAFRGELVPQNPDDEPASVLLERIAAARAKLALRPKQKPQPRSSDLNPASDQSLLNVIDQMDTAAFTFEELREHSSRGYESLKGELFALLADRKSGVEQYFDVEARCMKLRRVHK